MWSYIVNSPFSRLHTLSYNHSYTINTPCLIHLFTYNPLTSSRTLSTPPFSHLERRLEALQRQTPLEGSHYSLLTDGSSDSVQANTFANATTTTNPLGRPGGGGLPGSFGSPPRRLPPIAPRSPVPGGRYGHSLLYCPNMSSSSNALAGTFSSNH